MNRQIILRSYLEKDSEALTAVIREAWKYDEFSSPRTAEKLAKIFLYSCLSNQTFTQVAEADGIPVGIIMVKNIKTHKCPLRFRIRQAASIFSLLITKEGRKTAKVFRDVNGIDKELLAGCGRNYQGEIAFFAVSSAYRGSGIGKMLFEKALSYMKSENIRDFYLFTDTSCNYGFYEHQGMKRQCEKEHFFQIGSQKAKMDFFLYDRHL
ncbi:GNAT family N-acetyltransferase [Qiania dongpingensis]|uniref:GNAT family N-acetyltransferase n=1 Tax=Qiania dongpingensis TaxID=2763669 RepID=A0A7G9G1V5_9FIRM|nr:GNAT family N-acetyltransferase [Qiania dongpingensis]QNM04787.1 GNAT family N-acetyltransferase [Qiania dongpingensis]